MPANLVPHAAIPELAQRVTPQMLEVLRHIQRVGFIPDGKEVEQKIGPSLRQLTELGLIDHVYEDKAGLQPGFWARNGNGERVLAYLLGIRGGPHYEIPAVELAAWLEGQGKDRWWNVDGDPLLNGRMTFPCPPKDLADALRQINRPLLVQAKKEDASAKGQVIGKEKLNDVVGYFAENLHVSDERELPPWGKDRLLYLCWKGAFHEWLLAEDREAAEQMATDHGHGADNARVKRE